MIRRLRKRAGYCVLATILAVSGCSHDRSPVNCEGGLGVHRTVTLKAGSTPLAEQLQPGEVVLTFDDGPDLFRTRPVLDLLASECTQASFFLIGTQAEKHPSIVRDILAHGHTVGSHSWSHPDLSKIPLDQALVDIRRGHAAVKAAAGQNVAFFRFPFISATPDLYAAIAADGLIDVTVTIDGQDWTDLQAGQSAAIIMSKLEANQRRGIVLLHDPYFRSDERARFLLNSLKTEGYRVVAISCEGC